MKLLILELCHMGCITVLNSRDLVLDLQNKKNIYEIREFVCIILLRKREF